MVFDFKIKTKQNTVDIGEAMCLSDSLLCFVLAFLPAAEESTASAGVKALDLFTALQSYSFSALSQAQSLNLRSSFCKEGTADTVAATLIRPELP